MIWLACSVWTDVAAKLPSVEMRSNAMFMYVEADSHESAALLATELAKVAAPGHDMYQSYAILPSALASINPMGWDIIESHP